LNTTNSFNHGLLLVTVVVVFSSVNQASG